MTTVRDIITRAYRKIGVVAMGEAVPADEMQHGVDVFNDMLWGWKPRGVDIQHEGLDASDDFALDRQFHEGAVYVLASRLSPDFSAPQGFDADDWFRALQAAFIVIDKVNFPETLTYLPSRLNDRFEHGRLGLKIDVEDLG